MRGGARAEHLVLAVAMAALAVLVVFPLASLVWGSVSDAGRPTPAHFREALSSRLHVQALRNSLVLGAWTAVLSVAVGLPMAWAVSRTDVPGKRFAHLVVTISYLTPPFLLTDCVVLLADGTRVRVQAGAEDVVEVGQAVSVRFDPRAGIVFPA